MYINFPELSYQIDLVKIGNFYRSSNGSLLYFIHQGQRKSIPCHLDNFHLAVHRKAFVLICPNYQYYQLITINGQYSSLLRVCFGKKINRNIYLLSNYLEQDKEKLQILKIFDEQRLSIKPSNNSDDPRKFNIREFPFRANKIFFENNDLIIESINDKFRFNLDSFCLGPDHDMDCND